MSQQREQSSPVATHLYGIASSLAAGGLAALVFLGVKPFWRHFLHNDPPEWANEVIPWLTSFIALLAIILLVKATRSIQRARKHATATAKGDRISILVAELGESEECESVRDLVISSIQTELGKHVELIRAGVRLTLTPGVSEDEGTIKPAEEARKLLRKKHGDLLIWGKLHKIGGRTQIELRFVSAAQDQDGAERKVFALGETFTLEVKFGPEMAAALAAVVASQAAEIVGDGGKYVVDVLRPLAVRLSGLRHHLPVSMTPDDRASLLFAYAYSAQMIGEQAGESVALLEAVDAYREALKEYTRDRVPLQWAMTQNNLGNALARLGERESGTERLEEAVAASREALKERTRDRVPLQWAMTQNNLGTALARLGERESGTERLEEAVATFREILKVVTRDSVPLRWAAAQYNLGNALQLLSARESGTLRLEEAVTAYREALKECTRNRVPLRWAATQNNLGATLQLLGRQEIGTERLEEAVAAHREALKECTRDRVPLQWAKTQYNLGTALLSLGERESGTELLGEAVAAFREALKEYTRDRVPRDWAMTQNNLGSALAIMGERESGTERLLEAVTALRDALSVCSLISEADYHEIYQRNLALAEAELAKRPANP